MSSKQTLDHLDKMEPLAAIIGIGILVFLLLYIAFNIQTKNEITLEIIKFYIILFAVFFLILIPKVAVDASTECQILLNSTDKTDFYVYGNQFNQTDENHWDQEQISPGIYPNLNLNQDYVLFHIVINETNHYSEYCTTTPYNTNSLIFKNYMFFVSTFMILLFLYFTFIALKKIKINWSK